MVSVESKSNQMNNIIKVVDSQSEFVWKRDIFGLNIFQKNNIINGTNPLFIFLSAIVSGLKCSALIGGLALEGDSFDEFKSSFSINLDMVANNLGVHGGTFYRLPDIPENLMESIFIPRLDSLLFDQDTDIFQYFRVCDAFCLFTQASKTTDDAMKLLFSSEISSHAKIVGELCNIFGMIVMTNTDGNHLSLLTKDKSRLSEIDGIIDQSIQLISISEFFKENEKSLTWDDDYDLCLKLKGNGRN